MQVNLEYPFLNGLGNVKIISLNLKCTSKPLDN